MVKLFLKTFGLLFAVIIAAFLVQSEILEYMVSEASKKHRVDARERFVPIFYFLERELTPHPRAEWPARLEAVRDGFTFPPRLVALDGIRDKVRPQFHGRLAEGKVVFSDIDPQVLLIMKRVHGTDEVLVMDAALMPSMRTESLIMNFVVEGLFVAAFILILVVLFWRDMKKLSNAADQIGRGNFDFELDVGRRSALHPVAESLNAMKLRIGQLLKSHRNLTNAVSHEFRTPITRLRFRHELAQIGATPAEKDKQLAAMTATIDQLDDLARELLEYARLDRETPHLDITPIETAPWLAELVEDARELARAECRPVQIGFDCTVESVEGDYRYLTRAAGNLLRNAVRYARGRVRISVEGAEGCRVLSVEDDGPGIPAAERTRLFEPFARVDSARDRDSGGFGMGLAIVQQVARWHGGSAAIATSGLGGARVTMSW